MLRNVSNNYVRQSGYVCVAYKWYMHGLLKFEVCCMVLFNKVFIYWCVNVHFKTLSLRTMSNMEMFPARKDQVTGILAVIIPQYRPSICNQTHTRTAQNLLQQPSFIVESLVVKNSCVFLKTKLSAGPELRDRESRFAIGF